ncbi:LLM class flavin-dependent oxidoreductase [Nakamurella leprariae]|uniref:LLM class flavin-dependent oxidoreductase n=1 Tax=Nakamurella leprariae TaxID=2803911 RepID=A0A938YAY5_9ACTN|nr:LLM class flavin-dependent oxidoreductase [Nakamurella leprariae]MBM9469186.1 LLM class flavin-dependent oxidoreductase [Nakamurella leprariae]
MTGQTDGTPANSTGSTPGVRAGIVVSVAEPRAFAELATAADRAGWDGIFTWESVWGQDAWATLAAAAMVTERIRLGTMLSPLPRIRPWDFAGRVATVDVLSGGRVQVAVGLGAIHDGWTAFEPDEGRRVRAEKLDEGLAVYDGLMRGQPFAHTGRHWSVRPTTFVPAPPPVQRPRVPVWVVGAHPSRRSLGRAARWDGILPTKVGWTEQTPFGPADLAEVVDAVRPLREAAGLPWAGYDVVAEGVTEPGPTADRLVGEWATAGATWWIESDWSMDGGTADLVARLRRRIEAGPPGR